MEKNYNCLFEARKQYLLSSMVADMRNEARSVPVFRESGNGAIRITLMPLSALADAWLGGLSDFGEHEENIPDVCEQEFVYSIVPGGSHTIQWVDPDDGHIEPVNCYAYSALKVAFLACVYKLKPEEGLAEIYDKMAEGVLPDVLKRYAEKMGWSIDPNIFNEENGWAAHHGTVYATVRLDGKEFLRIYACTSGASSKEDERCSIEGIKAARGFFERIDDSIAVRAYLEGEGTPDIHLDFEFECPFLD